MVLMPETVRRLCAAIQSADRLDTTLHCNIRAGHVLPTGNFTALLGTHALIWTYYVQNMSSSFSLNPGPAPRGYFRAGAADPPSE